MKTAFDRPLDELDEQDREVLTNIREHGWQCTHVFADEEGPSFTYTAGFWFSVGIPEVIVFDLPHETAHAVLWDLYREAIGGRRRAAGVPLDGVFGNADAYLVPVGKRHYPDFLGWNHWFYGGDDFPCHQLVWPDTHGTFPWQPDYEDRFAAAQPDLTERGWLDALAN